MQCSVAMGTYNGAQFIGEQLASLAAQSMQPAELVVVDDGSTDATLQIIEEFARTAPFAVRIYRNEARLGVVGNFCKALELCTSPIVFFSDQDDVWLPQKMARLAALFEDPACMAAACNAVVTRADLSRTRHDLWTSTGFTRAARRRTGMRYDRFLLECSNFVAGMSLAVRRDFALQCMPIPPHWYHDGWLVLVASIHGALRLVDETLVLYRQHGANVLGVPTLGTGDIDRLVGQRQATDVLTAYHQCGAARARLFDVLSDEQRMMLRSRELHLLERVQLPASRLARVPSVWRQHANGNYTRHSLGLLAVVRDLVRVIA